MITTLKIAIPYEYCRECDDCYEAIVEVDEGYKLSDLHLLIQWVLDFDNDHLFDFYLAASAHSRTTKKILYSYDEPTNTKIGGLFPLPKGRKLFYLFDYGDEWIFQISNSKKNPFLAEKGVKYPRLVSEKGEKPVQYPDDDEDEDEGRYNI